jgi:hypothetical protein
MVAACAHLPEFAGFIFASSKYVASLGRWRWRCSRTTVLSVHAHMFGNFRNFFNASRRQFRSHFSETPDLARACRIHRRTAEASILARPAALSAEHFNCAPDEPTLVNVDTLGSYLQRFGDAAFHEGEHAA